MELVHVTLLTVWKHENFETLVNFFFHKLKAVNNVVHQAQLTIELLEKGVKYVQS